MSRIFDKAQKMLEDNRHKRSWRGAAGALGIVFAAAVAALLVGTAVALTGGTTMQDALTQDSALFWESASGTETDWQKVDAQKPLDATSKLRLRLAFKLDAGALKAGSVLEYRLPDSIKLTSTEPVKGNVYTDATVKDPARTDATSIGTYTIKDNVVAFTFDESVCTKNAGPADGKAAGEALGGYADIDLTFEDLASDADGTAKLALSDLVKLEVTKKVETALTENAAAESSSSGTSTAAEAASVDTSDEETSSEDVAASDVSAEGAKSAAKAAPVLLAANDNSTIDLTNYITSTKVQKLVNGNYQDATEFNDGDTVKVSIAYKLPKNTLTSNSRVVTYTLPDGIKPAKATSGNIESGGKTTVGTYTIDASGKAMLTFNDDFSADGGAVEGTLKFTGTVSNSSTSSDKTVNFGGSSSSITIKKHEETPSTGEHDIAVAKTATLSPDRRTINYEVIASTTKGTDGAVTITDKLNKYNTKNANPTYDVSSIAVRKIDANGTSTALNSSDYKLTLDNTSTDSNGGPNFKIENLPALSAGEKYVVAYAANVNATNTDTVKVPNNASAGYEGNIQWSSKTVGWDKDIQKTGTYDVNTGQIVWTITVNPNGEDISNWRVVDILTGGRKLTQKYCVKSADGSFSQYFGNAGDTSVDFSFSSIASQLSDTQKKGKFYIYVYTDAPDGDGQVTNSATSTNGFGETTSGTGTTDVKHRSWDVSKKHTTEQLDNDTKATEHWNSSVTLPEGNITSFTFTDTIENARDENGNDMGADSHYAIASELEKEFASTVVDGKKTNSGHLYIKVDGYNRYYYAGYNQAGSFYDSYYDSQDGLTQDVDIKVTYYDANGDEVSASDTTTHVKSFKVTVTLKDKVQVKAQTMELESYTTHVDHASAAEGSSWKISNTAAVGDKKATTTFDFGNQKKLDKQVKTGSEYGTDTYKSGDTTLNYDKTNGVLTYRLLLSTTEADSGKTIIVTDTLPDGATLVDGSVRANFFADENNQQATNYNGTDFNGDQKPQATTSTVNGKTVMTVTIPNYKYYDDGNHQYSKIAIYYQLSVKDDPSWTKDRSKTYSNTAKWDSHSATSNTTIKRNATKVAKSGEQLDKDGNPVKIGTDGKPTVTPSGEVRYYVEVNTGAEDLDPNSDELELTDTLNLDTGTTESLQPKLDPNSIKVYAYDITKDHHYDEGKEIADYRVKYDETTHKITVELPDKTACVLVYVYQLNDSFVDGKTISNNASLSGKFSTDHTVTLKEVDSSATAEKARLVVYKTDEDDFHHTLKGATFELDYWDTASGSWNKINTQMPLTTDANGAITYDLEENADSLKANTLYRLKETEAPDGYACDAVRYFIWRASGVSADTAYGESKAANAKDDSGNAIQRSAIEFFSHAGGNMYITDKYTRVTVKKNWANDNGTTATAPSGASVRLQLYRSTKTMDKGDVVKVTVTSEGNTGQEKTKLDGTSDGVRYVKKGTDYTFQVAGYNGQTYTVYVDGVAKYTGTIDAFNTPVPVTLNNLTSDVTVDVKSGNYNAFSLSSKSWQDPKQILDGSSKTVVGDSVTVSAADSWIHNWDNLAQDDGNGHEYYYTVEELGYTVDGTYYEAGTSSKYAVSYFNNAGIQSGSITVTNSMPKSYVLPDTGGIGTHGYVFAGAAIAMGAATVLMLLRYMRRME